MTSPDEIGPTPGVASFQGASEYQNLQRVVPELEGPSEARVDRKRNGNRSDINRKAVSSSQVPFPDEALHPESGTQRRRYGLGGIGYYDPSECSEDENIQAYNMYRRLIDTTPPTNSSGNEQYYRDSLRKLEAAIFGQDGPVLAESDERLRGETKDYRYHGQPIRLTLALDPGPSVGDFELNQVIHEGQSEADMSDIGWRLRRSVEEQDATASGQRNEQVSVPPEGLMLGKEMQVPGLEYTKEALERRTTLSRQHVTIIPQEDGTIRIVDHSKNGTRVHESHWDTRKSA